jgi:hypothetical protein
MNKERLKLNARRSRRLSSQFSARSFGIVEATKTGASLGEASSQRLQIGGKGWIANLDTKGVPATKGWRVKSTSDPLPRFVKKQRIACLEFA